MVLRQMIRFGLVGVGATGVHMMIGVMLIHSGWQALAANAIAFVAAFLVSFVGHFGYSFADQEAEFFTSFWKFIFVGCLGFAFNETVLAVLIFTDILVGGPALLVSTLSAAILTFLLSRGWAFRGVAS